MLHEILLSLSGYHSQFFEKVRNGETQDHGLHSFTSQPERAMLETLAHIAELHIAIKQAATRVANNHPSVVCRSVASATTDIHLAAFRAKVIEVEASILQRDAAFVGGYGIVPLSSVVGEFAPWTRRLEWLSRLFAFTERQHADDSGRPYCTSNSILDFLEAETRTGYGDIEASAQSLLTAGEKVWMRSVASWILYGKMPVFGQDDFFIQPNPERTGALDGYILARSLLPSFVSIPAAESILAIGNALCQLQAHKPGDTTARITELLPKHLQILGCLRYPLNPSIFELAMEDIDSSISQYALSRILPLQQILGLLDVVHRFVLLGNGEFATALIENAAEKVKSRLTAPSTKPVRKVGRVDDLTIKQIELTSILHKTWDQLAALQSEQALDDESFNLARSFLSLSTVKDEENAFIQISTLMPNYATLNLNISPDSNLKFFLTNANILSYAAINAYLLSIRRAELHLSQLWKLTPQRRCHPTPLGPPLSASSFGQSALATRRTREQARSVAMRAHWASMSKALFVINQLDAYLHGEVIHNSWEHFQDWLHEGSQPGSSRGGSRPGTANSAKTGSSAGEGLGRSKQMNDPRTLAKGHHAFLEALVGGLLLDNVGYVTALRQLLGAVDHYVALFARLTAIWSGLDLQEDEGVVDTFSNYKDEERMVTAEMARCRGGLEEEIGELVTKLKEAERRRDVDGLTNGVDGLDLEGTKEFVPWKGRNMDRLIMKLEDLAGGSGKDGVEKLVDEFDEE